MAFVPSCARPVLYLYDLSIFIFFFFVLLIYVTDKIRFLFHQPGNIHFIIISNVTNVVLFIIGFDSYIVRVYLCLKHARGKPACFYNHKFHFLFT